MSDLSRSVLLSPSGVTRLVDRLEREGLVDRERCPEDGRGYYAVLTDAGDRRLQEARATHLAGVRRLFLDRLGDDDLRRLAAYWDLPGAGRRRHGRRVAPRGAGRGRAGLRRRRCLTSSSSAPASPASAAPASCTPPGSRCSSSSARDAPGGRVRTDEVDGFLLDRGFQVLLTAYPEARRVLDYERLGLRPFESGALIRRDGGFARLADPFRHPLKALESLREAPGSLPDKLRVARLRRRLSRFSLNELLTAPQVTTAEALRREGFSQRPRRRLLPPVPRRHLPRPLAGDLEPPVRLRLQAVRRGRGGAAGRRHAGDPAPAGRGPAGGGRALRRHGRVGRTGRGRPRRRRAPHGAGRRGRRGRAGGGPAHRRRRGAGAAGRDHAPLRRRALARRRAGARAERRGPRPGQRPLRAERRGAELRAAGGGAGLGHRARHPAAHGRGARRRRPRAARAAGSARRCRAGGCCASSASPSPCRRSRRRPSPRRSGRCACATACSSAATTATRPRSRGPWSRAAAPPPPSAGWTRRPPAPSDRRRPARPRGAAVRQTLPSSDAQAHHREHDRRHQHVAAVPLQRERDDRPGDAHERRRDQHEQAEREIGGGIRAP